MANKEYTINRFGKKVRYRKVGSKYFRVKADGTLAKDAATGLILANLKNATGSSIVSSPDKMLATVRSAVAGTNKRGQMGRIRTAMASTKTKDDGGKAKLQFAKDIKKVKRPDKALAVIKKDTNIKTDATPTTKKKVEAKKVEKKKDVKPLQKMESKKITTTKTKALQNMPKKQDKKTETKKEAPKRSKGFLERVKEDFKKAVKETKRNIQGDIKKGTGRYKSVNERNLDAKGNYKGTNIKPTELQLSRMKKEEMKKGGYAMKKKTKYMAKGGMKKTKYMAKGGMKKSKYMARGGAAKRK